MRKPLVHDPVTVTFRRGEQKLDVMVDNKTVGEGNTLFVRKFEVIELK